MCKNQKENQCKKGFFRNPAKCGCENGKYERNFGDLVVTCGELIKETKTIPTESTSTNFYILLAFLLITVALLIAFSINLIKHRSNQKYLLPYHDTIKLKETKIANIL